MTGLSRSNLEEIYTLRKRLEPFALELSVQQGDENQEERAAAALYMLGKRETKLKNNSDGHNEWDGAHRKFRPAPISGCWMPICCTFAAR